LYNNKKGNLWFNALGYLDKDGKNTVTQLMDPIPPPMKKESVKKTTNKQKRGKTKLAPGFT
jgi:hypothetical protein